MLQYPPEPEWGGRFWPGLPMLMPQYDMSCTGCCEFDKCCTKPNCNIGSATLTVTVLDAGTCTGAGGLTLTKVGAPSIINDYAGSQSGFGNVSFFCRIAGTTPHCNNADGSDCEWAFTTDNCGAGKVCPRDSVCDPFSATFTLNQGAFASDAIVLVEEP